MRWRAALILGAVACRRGDDGPAAPSPGETGPASSDPDAPAVVAADCAADPANALRATCTVTLDSPDDVVVTLAADGLDPLVFRSAGPSVSQAVRVWGLVPDTSFAWSVVPAGNGASASGTLEVPGLPPPLAGLRLDVVDAGEHGDEEVLFNYGCDGLQEALVAIDRAGRVRWYQDIAAVVPGEGLGPLSVRGFNLTPTGTVVAILDRGWVVEYPVDGPPLLVVERGGGFTRPVHHDVNRWGDLTYALFAELVQGPGGLAVMDGFYVFDATGAAVAEWHAAEHFVPTPGGAAGGGYWFDEFPTALDWSHTNSLAIGPDGGVTMSLRYQNALVHVVGDPSAPDFGEVGWILVGDPSASVLASTVALTSSAGIADLGFEQQHDASAIASDALTLWDNGTGAGAGSRALRLVVDGDTADFAQEWEAGAACPGQGSATLLPSGNVLLDCAPSDTLSEVDPAGVLRWSAHASCDAGLMLRPLYRGLPFHVLPASEAEDGVP